MEPADWKDFLLKYKWMSYGRVHDLYGIKRHDLIISVGSLRFSVLDPWRVSLQQPPERLRVSRMPGNTILLKCCLFDRTFLGS